MKALNKDILREIKNTSSRFISILILVALAVAFLSGLRATAPDMKGTLDKYMDEHEFMDIQVFSTLGLTDEDIQAIAEQPGVAFVEPSHQADMFAQSASRDLVVKVYSLPSRVNTLVVKDGRMPEAGDECIVDKKFLQDADMQIGDRVTLRHDGEDPVLKYEEFTITGVAASPYYISVERGTASIGSGSVDAFLYVPDGAFDLDYYAAAYVLAEGAEEAVAFSDEYNGAVDSLVDALKPFGELRAQKRYDDLIGDANRELDKAQGELDDAKEEAAQKLADAEKELEDARAELDDGWRKLRDGEREFEEGREDAYRQIEEGTQTLSDAAIELDDALAELEDGERQMADAKAELDDAAAELADAKAELADAEKELKDGKNELDGALASLQSGERQYSDGAAQYAAGVSELESGKAQLEEGRAAYELAKEYLPQAEQQLAGLQQQWDGRDEDTDVKAYANDLLEQAYQAASSGGASAEDLSRLRAAIDGIEARIDEEEDIDSLINEGFSRVDGYIAQAESLIAQFEAGEAEIAAGEAQLASAAAQLRSARAQLDNGWDQYYDGLAEYNRGVEKYQDGLAQYEDGRAKYEDGLAEYNKGRAELDDGWEKYNDGRAEYEEGLAELEKNKAELPQKLEDAQKELDDARRKLEDGEKEYADGYQEYLDGKAEAEEKIADAQEKLYDARRQISKITGCEWYVLSRSSNPGYLGFGQDADRMGNLAKVFPMLFFLVAALVCLTTMTRMVDDQRIQIGSLKAIGYSTFDISKKYIIYGALPALIGGVLGLAIGYTLFPKMIFTAYQIMYEVPDIRLLSYPDISAFSMIAGVACTTIATLWACLSALRSVPAALMRPKAPSAGKRVFLEYITPLWRRMNFFSKVTARNLFRYQKRFWMTVIGIGGCTALIIAGFGLRYSLLATMDRQFNDIFRYQAILNVDKDIIDEDREAVERFIADEPVITEVMPAYMNSVTAESPKYQTTAYIQVCDAGQLSGYVDLKDTATGEPIALEEGKVIIGQKLSELLGVKVGDSFTIDAGSRCEVTVGGINEHYLAHYVYMTPSTYESLFGKAAVPNAYQLKLSTNDDAVCKRIFEDFMKLEGASGTSRIFDIRDTYLNSMERIDFVVVIVIISAAALAMVVLYNLSNINITERKRELATIKVLGFFDGEVSAYVYRENIVLTIIGIALGILMGHILHTWLVKSVEIDLMMFGRDTDPRSYAFAAVLTAVFSVIVNVMAHKKMKLIDMVESLKSAE